MKNFIYSINNLLKQNKDKIPEIQTFKKGVLPPFPVFGAISILPISMSFNFGYSGGVYDKIKEVEIQIFLKGIKIDRIKEKLRKVSQSIIDLLVSNYTLDGQVYDLVVKSISFNDPLDLIDGILQGSKIRVIGYTRESITEKTLNSDLKFGDENKIISSIEEFIKENLTPTLKKVKNWYTHTIGPKMVYPIVLIDGSLDTQRLRSYTGMDTMTFLGGIHVFTKLMDKDFSLFSNLEIVEELAAILLKSGNFEGYFINHQLYEINYYRTLNPTLGLVYQTILTVLGEVPQRVSNNF